MNIVKYPKCGFVTQGRKVSRVLLLCCFERRSVPSIVEILETVQRLSDYPVTVLNLYEHRAEYMFLALPADYDLSAFSCVIIHNTVSYSPDNLFSLDRFLSVKLEHFDGVKILLKQDDFHRFKEVSDFIKIKNIDVVFTLTPLEEVHKVYNITDMQENFEVLHMLAGYVTPQMRSSKFLEHRPIDIGYRGSIMPLSFGRLCYEKRKIGDDVFRLLKERKDLKLNISSAWSDRLGGDDWYKFLSQCKAVLGVESGSGVFDLDGSLARKSSAIERKIGPFRADAEYAEAYLRELGEYDGNVKYFAISPRHFEAIAFGAVQVLFPGRYTDRMVAGRHYLELRRDYDNLSEIIDIIKNEKLRSEITERAFAEVILDKRNWIETFVRDLDAVVERQLTLKGVDTHNTPLAVGPSNRTNALLIQAHEHGSDPRRDKWLPDYCSEGLSISQMVIDRSTSTIDIRRSDKKDLIISLPYRPAYCIFDEYSGMFGGINPYINLLTQLRYLHELSSVEFAENVGAPLHSFRLHQLKAYIKYLLDTTAVLLDGFRAVKGIDVIIAVNLPTLFAALVIKQLHNTPIVYESLEYWPEADPDSAQFEIDFWVTLESLLIKDVDYVNTVSPGLAALMSKTYSRKVGVLPNCCPVDEYVERSAPMCVGETIRFLYQGSYAPHRGLEELVRAFGKVNCAATLYLRGPDNDFKTELLRLAKSEGIYDISVFFLPPVPPSDLVKAAQRDGDIAVIPYKAIGENYRNCSPNKMGQYFAAGMPILANDTQFVAYVVKASGAGIVTDFSDIDKLVLAIKKICSDKRQICIFAENAKNYFFQNFNWQQQSGELYRMIVDLAALNRRSSRDSNGITAYQTEHRSLFRKSGVVSVSEVGQVVHEGSESDAVVRTVFAEDDASARRRLHFTDKKWWFMIVARVASYTWPKLPGYIRSYLKPRLTRFIRRG
jgi:glycosyltransferase involved in cell wall biosynthesis